MTPFTLLATRPAAAVAAVQPVPAGAAAHAATGGGGAAAFAQLLSQHQQASPAPQVPSAPVAAQQPPVRMGESTPAPHTTAARALPERPAQTSENGSAKGSANNSAAPPADGPATADAPPSPPAPGTRQSAARHAKAQARPAAPAAPRSPATAGTPTDGPAADQTSASATTDASLPGAAPGAVPPPWTPPSAANTAPPAGGGAPAAADTPAGGTTDLAAQLGTLHTLLPTGPGVGADSEASAANTRQGDIRLPTDAGHGGAPHAPAGAPASALQALAAEAGALREGHLGVPAQGSDAAASSDFASQLAQLTGNASALPGRHADAPLVVTVPTPATAPTFPDALGLQVSLLAQDGVQHAELHLNPAEMGPISVRITLDGPQAHIDFGADSAQTRDILEAGLPELAAALSEAGLTLSGGGVSQHPQQPQQPPQGDPTGDRAEAGKGGAGRGGSGAGDEPDARTRGVALPLTAAQARSLARAAAGGLDTYA